jgi:2-oxoglutarate ferredoxin oxidoreductase subunit alpha
LDGNTALGLGAIQAGVRAYYAYPMSPASTILSYLAEVSHETGMVVKQAEDEITAAQMSLGSMFMGTRAFTATSGGGFDLMTETVSLAGMTETPLVIVLAQRPGPATGLPTWTAQADLLLAIHSGHGEYPKVVLACSDTSSCYEQIQHAFNLAEQYQCVVIVLTEKVIAEALMMVDPFTHGTIPIERGLVDTKEGLQKVYSEERYALTPTGVSKRWLPGSTKMHYYANGDEHWVDGSLTEEADHAAAMMEKRMRKEITILKALPEPAVHGVAKNANLSVVGWGSTKGVMEDVIRWYKKRGVAINYLHYDVVSPIKTTRLKQFFAENSNVCLLEGNYRGQLGGLIEHATGLRFADRLLKYDGRPFFFEEVIGWIEVRRLASKKL